MLTKRAGVPVRAPLSASEAAVRLGITRERVWRLVQTGGLVGGMKNGRWWIDPDSLDRYLAARGGRTGRRAFA